MDNFKAIFELVKSDGKAVVVGEDGQVLGVFLSFDAYQKLTQRTAGSLSHSKQQIDAEEINRQITAAQLQETHGPVEAGIKPESFVGPRTTPRPALPLDLPVSGDLKRRSKMLDLRQEVIDPSFNFDSQDDTNIEV